MNRASSGDKDERALPQRDGNGPARDRLPGDTQAAETVSEADGLANHLARWNTQALHLTALEALERFGWSVFPLDPEEKPPRTGGKHPDGAQKRLGWRPYQTRRASRDEVMDWRERYRPSAYAVITGRVSGVLILDFDGDAGKATIAALGLLPHVQTGSGGYHVYFRHPGWRVPTLSGKSKRVLGQQWPGLDIRADGGYGAFCGRSAHGRYRWLLNAGRSGTPGASGRCW